MSIVYNPPPTIKEFIKDHREGDLFYNWIIGPVGSAKTTALFMKLAYMAQLQAPSPDGIRRTRAVIVRNTMPQLKDTTMVSWNYWFRDGIAGHWNATDKIFTLRFGDTECVVMFRPLDTEDDVQRVLSLEINFAIIDEFVQIPRKIIEALSGRLGRFKLPDGTKPTNWGMWGASNPDTEDNWWYSYLHRLNDDPSLNMPPEPVARYFKQPSGRSEEAENLDNLPGGAKYYENLVIGKSETWIKQFVDSEWGYSIAGKPVIPTFKDLHIVSNLRLNPHLPLTIGMDPGLGGSAFIFGQLDFEGRLNVLGELVQEGYGVQRLIGERLKPYMRARWPELNFDKVVIACDPAGSFRAQTDEKTVVEIMAKHFRIITETNNRLPLRLDAINHFTTTLLENGPALRVDKEHCPTLIRALKGGWRYGMDTKKEIIKGDEPEKNAYSHPGDAFGYLCRYFHKQTEREMKYSGKAKRFIPPRFTANGYHAR